MSSSVGGSGFADDSGIHLGSAGLERLDGAENHLVGLFLVGHRIRIPVIDAAFVVEEHGQTAKLTLETAEVFAWTATVCLLSTVFERLLKAAVKRLGRGRAA